MIKFIKDNFLSHVIIGNVVICDICEELKKWISYCFKVGMNIRKVCSTKYKTVFFISMVNIVDLKFDINKCKIFFIEKADITNKLKLLY